MKYHVSGDVSVSFDSIIVEAEDEAAARQTAAIDAIRRSPLQRLRVVPIRDGYSREVHVRIYGEDHARYMVDLGKIDHGGYTYITDRYHILRWPVGAVPIPWCEITWPYVHPYDAAQLQAFYAVEPRPGAFASVRLNPIYSDIFPSLGLAVTECAQDDRGAIYYLGQHVGYVMQYGGWR